MSNHTSQLDPVDVFTPLREAVSRLFDEGLPTERLMFLGRSIPVDVIDMPEEYIMEASLTGV